MLTATQLAKRHNYLGSSDVAAIVGLNKFSCPAQVYGEKVGILKSEIKNTEAVDFGNFIEIPMVNRYAEQFNCAIKHNSETVIHPTFSWAAATVDSYAEQDGRRWIVEIKSTGEMMKGYWGPVGTEEVPDHVVVQVQWQMFVTGIDRADVYVVIGREFRRYTILKNEAFINKLVARASAFWMDHIEARVPPEITGSEGSKNLLTAIFPKTSDEKVPADDANEMDAARLRELSEEKKAADAEIDQIKARLCESIGCAKGMTHALGSFSWSEEGTTVKTDWKAVAAELKPSDELLAQHTKSFTKNRVFRPYWSRK